MRDASPSAVPCVIAALGILAEGCSVIVSKPPPSTPLAQYSDCHDSSVAVWVDGYLAATAALAAVIGFGGAGIRYMQLDNDPAPSWDPHHDTAALSPLLTMGAVSTVLAFGLIQSARYGSRSADLCRDARREMLMRWPQAGTSYFGPPDFGSAPRRPGEPADP